MANPNYNGGGFNGQTLNVPGGTYDGGYFGNMSGVTIDLTQCKFTGPVIFENLSDFKINGGYWSNFNNSACQWNGKAKNGYIKGRKFENVNSTIDNIGQWQYGYNGNDDSLVWNNLTFESDVLIGSGQYCQGSWAAGSQPLGYCAGVKWLNVTITDTLSNGTQIRGSFFEFVVDGMKMVYKKNGGVNPNLGDVGMLYVNGNGNVKNCTVEGGRGYAIRLWQCCRTGHTQDSYIQNNVKMRTNTYGLIDARQDDKAGPFTTLTGNIYVMNNTQFDCSDSIGYWSSVAVIGQLAPGMHVYVKNNIGANIGTNGKDPIAMDQSNNTWQPSDASNNKYYQTSAEVVDPATGIKKISLPGIGYEPAGTTVPPIIIPPPVTQRKAVKVEQIIQNKITYDDGSTQTI